MITYAEYEELVKRAFKNNSIVWHEMCELKDGKKLCLVVDGNDLCAKLAVNIDDLQCDFDVDWYMPYGVDDNEVYDTMLYVDVILQEDCAFFNNSAKSIKELYDEGRLKVC